MLALLLPAARRAYVVTDRCGWAVDGRRAFATKGGGDDAAGRMWGR